MDPPGPRRSSSTRSRLSSFPRLLDTADSASSRSAVVTAPTIKAFRRSTEAASRPGDVNLSCHNLFTIHLLRTPALPRCSRCTRRGERTTRPMRRTECPSSKDRMATHRQRTRPAKSCRIVTRSRDNSLMTAAQNRGTVCRTDPFRFLEGAPVVLRFFFARPLSIVHLDITGPFTVG